MYDRYETQYYLEETQMTNKHWLFYCRDDKSVFELAHNSCSWPSKMSLAEKLSLKQQAKMTFKSIGGSHECSFIKIVQKENLKKEMEAASEKLQKARELELSLVELSLPE